MKKMNFDKLVQNILLQEGALPKEILFQNKKFNLTKFKDKAEEAKEGMKMLAGAKWLGNIQPEKIESVFDELIKELGEEPITYGDLLSIIDNSVRKSFATRKDLQVKWGRQFRNMFERLNDIQETESNPVKKEVVSPSEGEETPEKPQTTTPVQSSPTKEVKEIRDTASKRFWEKILGEGEFSRKDLAKMFIEDNPDTDEDAVPIKISDLIMAGYLKKTESGNYEAVDPSETEDTKQEEEGEGSGEITSGINPEDVEEIGSEWGNDDLGVDLGSDDEGRPFRI